jgi:hypothetical protein
MSVGLKKILLSMRQLVPDMLVELFGADYQHKLDESSLLFVSDISHYLGKISKSSDVIDDVDTFIDISGKIVSLIKLARSEVVISIKQTETSFKQLDNAIDNLIYYVGLKTNKAGKSLLLSSFKKELLKKSDVNYDLQASINKLIRLLEQCDNLLESFMVDLTNSFDDLVPELSSKESFTVFLKISYITADYLKAKLPKEIFKPFEKIITNKLTEMTRTFVNSYGEELAKESLFVVIGQLHLRYQNAMYKMLPKELSMGIRLYKKVDITDIIKDQSGIQNVSGIVINKVDGAGIGINTIIKKINHGEIRLSELVNLYNDVESRDYENVINLLSDSDKEIVLEYINKAG